MGTRLRKRWRYIGAYCEEVMVCVGDVRVGPAPQRFWASAEPGRPVSEATTIARGGVTIDGSHALVQTDGVRIDLRVDESGDEALETTHPSGRGQVWTRKQAGVPVTGEVRVGSRTYSLDCLGVVDDTDGHHQRHTQWTWCTGVGRGTGGERVGWNLVAGVNDAPKGSERAVWIDGVATEPGPVVFADDLSRVTFAEGGELHFKEWAARENRTNLLIVRSYYRQPFGLFAGELPGGVQLADGYGVMEVHDVHW